MAMLEKQSQSNVKLNNLRLILKMLIQHDTLSRADLVRLTYISKPTVSNLIEELINLNLVREVGAGISKTGRKPILLKFNSTLKYFLVFTIGREEYHVAVADLKGQICDSYMGEFSTSQSYHDRLSLLQVSMQNLLDRYHIPHDKLLKIHGAAPGVFIEKDQALSWSGHEIPKDQDTQTYLENIFQTPVILNHSSKIALYGEKIAGMARDAKDAVYIDIGYGLGCSFLFNNQVYFGANNSAGEIGYVYSDLKEFEAYKLEPYGWGALETIISGKAFQQKGRELALKHTESEILKLAGGNPDCITAKTVFDAARKNDPHAFFILKESFRYFNMWLCNIINMLNPERIIFGGGVSNAGGILLDLITHEISDKVMIMPELTISSLQEKATVIGAVSYLIEHTDFFTEL